MGAVKERTGKPRLLIILNRFVIGGQAVDTIPLASELMNTFDVLILYGEKEKDEIEPSFLLQQYPSLILRRVPQLRRSINPLTDIAAFFRLYAIISNYKAHIVHTHGAKSGVLGRLAAIFSRVPVIIHTFHGHFFHSYFSSFVSKLVAFVERVIGKVTTAAIALSETQKHDLAMVYRILPARKITVIPLGFTYVTDRSEAELRQSFRQQYGLAENDIAIGIVGRIVPVKNHSFFVRIVKHYYEQFPESSAIFFVIGDGELRMQVEEEFASNQISYTFGKVSPGVKVVFTSWLQEMDEVMTGLDITVLTSLNEGTPLSMIESQFFGRPVIATHVGGVKDTMIDGKTGYLVEQNATAEYVAKLHQLLHDKQLRQQMGEASKEFVRQKFSKQNEVNITRDFYLSLLRKKKILFTD